MRKRNEWWKEKLKREFFTKRYKTDVYKTNVFISSNSANASADSTTTATDKVKGIERDENSILFNEGKKKSLLQFEDRSTLDDISTTSVLSFPKYEIDETFCSSITKKRKLLNLISYNIAEKHQNIFYKKSDGTDNAFLFSNKIKPLQFSERINEVLLVHFLESDKIGKNRTVKKNLFDILYKKYSLVFFFKNTDHINEMNKYLNEFNELEKKSKEGTIIGRNNDINRDTNRNIHFDTFLQVKKNKIHLFYCYVSPYKFLLGDYFSRKISENLRTNYFKTKNFFFMNKGLNIEDENCFLLDTSLPSLLLIDKNCFVRYHIKGLFTKEASYYLFKVLNNL